MPQFDFGQLFSDRDEQSSSRSVPSDSHAAQPSGAASIDYVAPAKSRRSRFGRAEWTNVIFVVIAVLGGLFVAFFFFNGADLFRVVGSWPRELLYPLPASHNSLGKNPPRAGLDGPPPVGPRTDPSGDPFSRAGGPLSLEPPSLAKLARGITGGGAGRPNAPGVPGMPGLPAIVPPGGINPGTLISQLGLLAPGMDALSKIFNDAVASLQRDSRNEAERTVVVVQGDGASAAAEDID